MRRLGSVRSTIDFSWTWKWNANNVLLFSLWCNLKGKTSATTTPEWCNSLGSSHHQNRHTKIKVAQSSLGNFQGQPYNSGQGIAYWCCFGGGKWLNGHKLNVFRSRSRSRHWKTISWRCKWFNKHFARSWTKEITCSSIADIESTLL
jgi:hypothetical protein